MLPIYTVKKEGFKAMLRKFNPRYDLPSRNHFSRVVLPALYSETREKLEMLLGGDEVECTLVQVLTNLGKFSGVVATTVKVKTQHLIVDKGGNFLILFLLNLSMIQVQQTEFL